MASQTSTAQRIADALLQTQGTTLKDEILAGRDRGESFERIARNLVSRTDGAIDVSSNTIRNWHASYTQAAA